VPPQYICHLSRILNREPDASNTIPQSGNKNPVALGPLVILWKPCPQISRAPKPPTSSPKRRVSALDALDDVQRNVFITAGRVIVIVKNKLLVGNLDQAVLIDGAHRARDVFLDEAVWDLLLCSLQFCGKTILQIGKNHAPAVGKLLFLGECGTGGNEYRKIPPELIS